MNYNNVNNNNNYNDKINIKNIIILREIKILSLIIWTIITF